MPHACKCVELINKTEKRMRKSNKLVYEYLLVETIAIHLNLD